MIFKEDTLMVQLKQNDMLGLLTQQQNGTGNPGQKKTLNGWKKQKKLPIAKPKPLAPEYKINLI